MYDDSRLVTRGAFIRQFWEVLRKRREADPAVSQRAVYEDMDEHRESVYGEPLFPSFDAFRMYRDYPYKKRTQKRRKFHNKGVKQ